MGFFENAYDFEVSGGSFYDIRGDQINRTDDNSMRIGGTGNKTQISPDLSRQDNRAYNHREEQYTAYRGPTESQPSTYPGYGHMPPAAQGMPSQAHAPLGQPAMDPLYQQYLQWCEFKRWQEWQQFQQQQQQQHQQQQQYSYQGPPSAPPPESTSSSQQQPSQPIPTTAYQSHPDQNTPVDAQQFLYEHEEDPEVQDLGYQFGRQHIGEQAEYAYSRNSSQSIHVQNANLRNF